MTWCGRIMRGVERKRYYFGQAKLDFCDLLDVGITLQCTGSRDHLFLRPSLFYSISLLSSRFCRPFLSILLLLSCHYRRASVISLLPPILPCRFLACNLVVTFSIFSSIFVASFPICVLVICTGSSCGVLRH
jgi:hypothetical protein